MAGSQSHPNEQGVESFQMLDTFVSDGSGVNRELEQSALAAVVARVLVSKGWKDSDAERVVQGLDVKQLWAMLREPQPRAATAASPRTPGC
jgi:hypothetical protein